MAASKQAHKYTHTLVQCSPASVGLTQARSNKEVQLLIVKSQSNFLNVVLITTVTKDATLFSAVRIYVQQLHYSQVFLPLILDALLRLRVLVVERPGNKAK